MQTSPCILCLPLSPGECTSEDLWQSGLHLGPGRSQASAVQTVADASPFVATIMANQTAVHAVPAAINRLTETLLASVGAADARVHLVSSPMPEVPGEQSVKIQETAGDWLAALHLLLGAWCCQSSG